MGQVGSSHDNKNGDGFFEWGVMTTHRTPYDHSHYIRWARWEVVRIIKMVMYFYEWGAM